MDKWGLNRVDRSPAVSYSRTRSTLLFLSEEHSACFSKAPEVEMPQNFPGRSTDTFSYSCYRNYTQRTKLQISQVSCVRPSRWQLLSKEACCKNRYWTAEKIQIKHKSVPQSWMCTSFDGGYQQPQQYWQICYSCSTALRLRSKGKRKDRIWTSFSKGFHFLVAVI